MHQLSNHPVGSQLLNQMGVAADTAQLENLNTNDEEDDSSTGPTNPLAALLNMGGGNGSNNTSNNPPHTTNPSSAAMPNLWGSSVPTPNVQSQSVSNTNATPNPFAGFGGMGGAPNLDQLEQLLDNPVFAASMQQMASDPNFLQNAINSNPMMKSMIDSNPQMKQMFENPAIRQMLANPQALKSMIQMQKGMQGLQNSGAFGSLFGNSAIPGGTGSATTPMNPFVMPNIIPPMPQNNSGSANNTNSNSNQPEVNYHELYASQLETMHSMGLLDDSKNIQALRSCNGDVQTAINMLFNYT